MTPEEIEVIKRVQEGLEEDVFLDAKPLKDFCSQDELIETCSTALIILDWLLPNWKEEVSFNENGFISNPRPPHPISIPQPN